MPFTFLRLNKKQKQWSIEYNKLFDLDANFEGMGQL